MDWGPIEREAWETLTPHVPLQQTWLWGEVLSEAGAEVVRLAQRDGAAPAALAQVAGRRLGPLSLALVSRGPVRLAPQSPHALGRLPAALPWPRPRAVIVTQEAGRPARSIPLLTPAWHAELGLDRPLADVRAGLDPKLRNKVSRAERSRLDVAREDDRPSRYAWLFDAETRQARTRRYRNWPPHLVARWQVRGGAVRNYVARNGGEPLAAMLFLLHGRVATYHVGWAGAEGRRAAAHPLCLWRAIVELREAGVERIDLGTVDAEAAPGLARFKLATGAAVRPLGPTCLLLPSRSRPARRGR